MSWREERGERDATHRFRRKINAETYAICRADLQLNGEGEGRGEHPERPRALDPSPTTLLDARVRLIVSNSPYGKSWKADLDRVWSRTRRRRVTTDSCSNTRAVPKVRSQVLPHSAPACWMAAQRLSKPFAEGAAHIWGNPPGRRRRGRTSVHASSGNPSR